MMDHKEIEDRQIVSLYLARKLSAEERTRFEEHFVECSQCLDELELTEGFRTALRNADPQTTRGGPHALQGPLAWIAQMGSRQQAALVAGVFVLVVAPLLSLLIFSANLRRQIEEERKDAESYRERYEVEKQARVEAESKLAQSALPQFAAPLYSVPLTRSVDASDSAGATQVILPRADTPAIILSLEMAPLPEFQSYRARLSDAAGNVVWSTTQIPPPPASALAISLRPNLLHPGNYALTLEGLTAGGRFVRAGSYRFEVLPR
jgi:hypothetical protein